MMATVDEVRSELLEQADRLAGQTRRVVLGQAALSFVAVMVATTILLVWIDSWIRSDELGMRLVFAAVLVSAGLFLSWKWLLPAWNFRPSKLDVANWIEQSEPEAKGLASMLEVAELPEEDRRYGSKSLREVALHRWAQAGYQPSWQQYLDLRLWRWAIASLLAAVVLALTCAAIWPQSSWLGLQRLVAPWLEAPWPRQDILRFRDPPEAIPLGSELQLEVIDLNPPMPPDVEVLLRETDSQNIYRVPTSALGNVAVANLSIVERSIDVAIRGGDSRLSDWHPIEVVQPPDLESSTFYVEAPEYTREPRAEVRGRRARVLAGSRVRLEGRLSAPVEALNLKLLQSEAGDSEEKDGVDWVAMLGKDRQSFTIATSQGDAWTAHQSLRWQLQIRVDGNLRITLPELWSIETQADEPPRVMLKATDLDVITSQAQVRLDGLVEDDLGLIEVIAMAKLNPTNTGPTTPSEADFTTRLEDFVGASLPPRRQVIERLWKWSSAESESLPEGTKVEIWLEAKDTLGQTGRSEPFLLRIASPEQVLESIAQRQQDFLEHLAETVNSQQRTRQATSRQREILEESTTLEAETKDALSRVSQLQQAIALEIQANTARRSLQDEANELQELFQRNELGMSAEANAMRRVTKLLDEVAEGPLPEAVQLSAAASRQSQTTTDVDSALTEQLAELERAQAAVDEPLQELLDELSQRQATSRLKQKLMEIVTQQAQVRQDTDNLRVDTLAGADADVAQQRRTALKVDQAALARKLDETLEQIQDVSQEDESGDATQALSEAASAIVAARVSNAMRQGTQALQQENLDEAVQQQDIALEAMRQALSASEQGTSSGTAQALEQASQALQQLAQAQGQLAEAVESADTNQMEALADQQADLQSQAERQAERLGAEGQWRLSDLIESAARKQAQAGQSMQEGNRNAGSEQAQQAASELEEAANEAEETRQAMEEEDRLRDLFLLASELETLVELQTPIVERLEELALEMMEQTVQTNQVKPRVAPLLEQEEGARELLREVQTKAQELPAFGWLLDKVEEDMSRAIAAGKRQRVVPEMLQSSQQALIRLSLALEALAQADPEEDSSGDNEDESDGASESPEAEDSEGRLVPPLASLKLLRGLQTMINTQTKRFNTLPDSPVRSRQLQELAEDQKELGERLEQLVRELAEQRREE